MKITQDVRDYASRLQVAEHDAITTGMAEKAAEFAEQGGEIYK